MRLCRFEIKNYKGIESLVVEWDEFLVLIGENNCGKSSVMAALATYLSGSSIKDSSVFRRHQTGADDAIEFVGHFDCLTDIEQRQVAVTGRMHDGKWILKKRYWFEVGEGDEAERGGWREQLFSFSSEEEFRDWPNPDTTWASFPADYELLIQQLIDRPARPNADARGALRELVRIHRPDLLQRGNPRWVPNPGGGGNWKSNANSIMPRTIYVRAVHEATDETNAKDSSTYGRLINLIVERQLSQRPEMQTLRVALEQVLRLFRPDEEHPEQQAEEIRELQRKINERLSDVIGGQAFIKTELPEIRSLVLPSTGLVIRDPIAGVVTDVEHQGHGLQRTLVMTLLQLLTEIQGQPEARDGGMQRATVLLVEEPELYLHPQMERLMRDVLYRLAAQPAMQVACCTHSPVFLDIADKYRSILRMVKAPSGDATGHQVSYDLFPGPAHEAEKEQLKTVARFHPTVNELFFATKVVLLEEFTAVAAFERAAELSGLFIRHKRLRREVSLVDCQGKGNIKAFQRVLNAFCIPYRVVHDLDYGNAQAFACNAAIEAAAQGNAGASIHIVGPVDIESMLGYASSKSAGKPFAAVKKVEELHALGAVPPTFIEALNFVYFGQVAEPVPA